MLETNKENQSGLDINALFCVVPLYKTCMRLDRTKYLDEILMVLQQKFGVKRSLDFINDLYTDI